MFNNTEYFCNIAIKNALFTIQTSLISFKILAKQQYFGSNWERRREQFFRKGAKDLRPRAKNYLWKHLEEGKVVDNCQKQNITD